MSTMDNDTAFPIEPTKLSQIREVASGLYDHAQDYLRDEGVDSRNRAIISAWVADMAAIVALIDGMEVEE